MEKENKQLQTTKPQTPSTARKVISIVVLALVAILSISIILCAYLPKNFNFGLNNPEYIIVHSTDNKNVDNTSYFKQGEYSDGKVYNKIMDLYNQSFKTTILGAMFQGKAFTNVSAEEGYKSLSSLTGTSIEFVYQNSQKLMLNGKPYKASIVSNTDYISVVIEVVNNQSLAKVNAYFKYRDTGSNNYSYVRFATYSAQADLYDYLVNGIQSKNAK